MWVEIVCSSTSRVTPRKTPSRTNSLSVKGQTWKDRVMSEELSDIRKPFKNTQKLNRPKASKIKASTSCPLHEQ